MFGRLGRKSRSADLTGVHFHREEKNPLESPNITLCVFKRVKKIGERHVIEKTRNGLNLMCDPHSTMDACVKLLASDSLVEKGVTLKTILENLPSTVLSEKPSQKSRETEQIYQSLLRIAPSGTEVVQTKISQEKITKADGEKIERYVPIKAVAERIEKCGSLIVAISQGRDPHQWIVIDNVVTINPRKTVVNSVPEYGFICRVPRNGTQLLANAFEVAHKLFVVGDTMFQLSTNKETLMTPSPVKAEEGSASSPIKAEGGATSVVKAEGGAPSKKKAPLSLDSETIIPLLDFNPDLSPAKVARFFNTAFNSATPSSFHETQELSLLRRRSVEALTLTIPDRDATAVEEDTDGILSATTPTGHFSMTRVLSSEIK
jgi:hypothetical protein